MGLKKPFFGVFAIGSLFFLPGCYLLCLLKSKPQEEMIIEEASEDVFEESISKDKSINQTILIEKKIPKKK